MVITQIIDMGQMKGAFFYQTSKLTHLDGDLTDGPGGIITHRNELWVEIKPQNRHEFRCRVNTRAHTIRRQYSLKTIINH